MAITLTSNVHVYINNFLVPLIENWFGNTVFFKDNSSDPRTKMIKAFLQESHITSMKWPAQNPCLNPNEHVR